jgi:hypothetical protein
MPFFHSFLAFVLLLFHLGLCRRLVALAPVPTLATNFRHVRAIATDGLASFTTDVRHVLPILTDGSASLASDFCHVRAIAAHGLSAFAPDTRHVRSILADDLPSLSPRFAGLVGRKLVRSTFDVCRLTPLACDLALPLLIHGSEAAPRFL